MRDMILVERVTNGDKCGDCDMRSYDPPYDGDTAYCEAFNEPLANGHQCFMRCSACLATPSAVVLTDEMVEDVKMMLAHDTIDGISGDNMKRDIDTLRSAFKHIEEASK